MLEITLYNKIAEIMKKHISNVSFDNADMLLQNKHRESEMIPYFIVSLFEKLNYLFKIHRGEEIYLKRIRKIFTKEVDPTYAWRFNFQMPKHEFEIYFPIVNYDGTILLHGNKYVLIYQMIDKPIFWKKQSVNLQTNVGFQIRTIDLLQPETIKSFKPVKIAVSNNKNHILAPLFFIATMGLNKVEEFLGVKLNIPDLNQNIGEAFQNQSFTWEVVDSKKYSQWNLQQIERFLQSFYYLPEVHGNKAPGLSRGKVEKLLDQEFYTKIYNKISGTKDLNWLNANIKSLEAFDPFTYQFIDYDGDLIKSFLSIMLKDKPNFLDVSNKRIRLMEIYLSKLLTYLYNLSVSLIMGKRIDLRSMQKFRIDDIVTTSQLSMFNYRFNSMMNLSESAKLTQVGELGLNRESFMHRRSVHESQYGYLCPISTPDRENCGVVLHLALFSKKDFSKFYKWPEISNSERLPLKKIEEMPKELDIASQTIKKQSKEELEKEIFKE